LERFLLRDNSPLFPVVTGEMKSPYRKGVQELVADEHRIFFSQVAEAGDVADIRILSVKFLTLCSTQGREGLDQTIRKVRPNPENVAGQVAGVSALLDDAERAGSAPEFVDLADLACEQLTEARADTDAGEEIAAAANGVVPAVVSGNRVIKSKPHEFLKRKAKRSKRSLLPDFFEKGSVLGWISYVHPSTLVRLKNPGIRE
jgi:hypothetical protein